MERNVAKRTGKASRATPQSASTSPPRVTLASYVERVKPGVTLDVWQHDLCARLEKAFWLARAEFFKFEEVGIGAGRPYVVAPSGFRIDLEEFEERKGRGTRAAIHAPPQFGKSVIISQAYPAWILGYEPTHRFRLATYNISHSKAFSEVVLHILRSEEHAALFPSADSRVPERCSSVKWFTNARRRVNDGQSSFTALGLQSGFVGTGADTLLEDDPYKSIEEALSEVIRDKTWRFNTDTAFPRLGESSNVFIMFHRYHQDDCGGRAIATGEFELWRYAAEADGDYVDDETGLVYSDPLMRAEGSPLSGRFPAAYYARQKRNEQVWFSQFQGRPTSKAGQMFNVDRFRLVHRDDVPAMLAQVRAWDNAATEEGKGASAHTAGVKKGIDAAGNFYVFDVVREQVGTDGREELQVATAERDGKLCAVRAPQDPGSAGKDIAFKFRQLLRDYQVETEPVTGTKTARAHNYSVDVNLGKYFIVCEERNDRGEPVPPAWFKTFKEEHRFFPVGKTKDMVDAGADGHKQLAGIYYRGLVVKGYDPRASLFGWGDFSKRFGPLIPAEWEVSAALRVSADSSKPSGFCVVARASEYAQVGEAVFLVASARLYAREPGEVLSALRAALAATCASGPSHANPVWLGRDSEDVIQLALEKYDLGLAKFKDDAAAGLPETNWYFQAAEGARNPLIEGAPGSHLFLLVADRQAAEPQDEAGLLSTRQELGTWAYTDKGEPQAYGGVTLDCARMCLYNFALTATAMSKEQRIEIHLPQELQARAVMAKRGTSEFSEAVLARRHAIAEEEKKERAEEGQGNKEWARFLPRPVQRRRR